MSIGVAPSASTMSNTVHVSMTSALPSSYRAMSSSVYGSQSFLRHPRLFPQSAQFRRNQLLVAPSRRSQRNDVIGFFALFRHFLTLPSPYGLPNLDRRLWPCPDSLAGDVSARRRGMAAPSGSWRVSHGNRSLRHFASVFGCQGTPEFARCSNAPSINRKRKGKVRLFSTENFPKALKSAFCTKRKEDFIAYACCL